MRSVAIIMTLGMAVLAASVWVGRYLRSETFRELIGAKTGEAVGSKVTCGPLRWMGSSVFVDRRYRANSKCGTKSAQNTVDAFTPLMK